MSLGQDTAPKTSDLLMSPSSPSSPSSPRTPMSPNENMEAYNDLKRYIQNTWQGLGYLTTKVDEHKGFASTLAASAGAAWAAYEIYQNPAKMAQFVAHSQLPELVVRTCIVSLGMLMTALPTVTTLYGGKAVVNQVKKGRKRNALQAELEEPKQAEKPSENQLVLAIKDNNESEFGTFEFDLNLTEDSLALPKPNPTYTPGANQNKRRKIAHPNPAEEASLLFKTPFIPQ